jgi:hypothetical protein
VCVPPLPQRAMVGVEDVPHRYGGLSVAVSLC